MHTSKNANQLFLLSGSKNFRRFLVLLLALAATSVSRQESVLTAAMVRYDQAPARRCAVVSNNSAANLLVYTAPTPHLQSRAAASKPDGQKTADFPSVSRLEKQSGSYQRDLFQLVHTKLYADGRAGKWMDVAAGYGQVCDFESGIAENMAELERPSRAYVKASFSF